MIDYTKESHETLLRIESLIKNLLSSHYQNQLQDKVDIKAYLVFDKNKLAEFKEEREKLWKTASFKCYWDNDKRTWVFDGKKKILEDFVAAFQRRGIPLEVNEVEK